MRAGLLREVSERSRTVPCVRLRGPSQRRRSRASHGRERHIRGETQNGFGDPGAEWNPYSFSGNVLYCNSHHVFLTAMARTLTVRLPDHEADRLAAFAKETGRTRSEIVRSYIRSLPAVAKKPPVRRRKAPSRRTP